MDRNTIIGLSLIFVLFFAWQYFTAPSREEIEAQKRTQDSLARVERAADSLTRLKTQSSAKSTAAAPVSDSARIREMSGTFGPFAAAAVGKESEIALENELLKITFSTKGGRIKEVRLKQYAKMERGKNRKDVKAPLVLLSAPKNRLDFIIPLKGIPGNGINTGDLYFEPVRKGNELVFRASAGEGKYFEQRYALPANDYKIDYSIKLEGLDQDLASGQDMLTLNWVNYLSKIEKSTRYERTYSTLYFRPEEGRVGRCSPTANDDREDAEGVVLKWVSSSNQFFNATLFAEKTFHSGVMETKSLPETADYMKVTSTTLQIPASETVGNGFVMHFYTGPNEFKRLYEMGYGLEEVIPFGRSILGTINRWVIRPLFSWLSSFIGSAGLVIFMLTLLVKLLLYPLSYRMLYSQAKMSALKPEMEKMREKYKDDQQRQQMETMTLYREFGVNPLGSCMPMLLQMPIWIALYRFFPASIEFRQKGFWWANDLSSYDEFFRLPFSIPLGFGDHISLFTLLWVVTTLIYTWYNSKSMDFSANPALKYMQYIMPVMFMGFFNGYASGLTAYLLFSNVINIGQTLVTKHLIIDEEKIKRDMEAFRKKPKKQKGFSVRLEEAMKEQQRIAAEREAKAKKKR